jgi:hypothetical protein
MAIKIINRSMDIPIPERTIGYIGDNRVETRAFELARMYGDVDLSTFDFKLDTEINGIKNIIDLDKSVTEDKITLTWTIRESHILTPGRMAIQLRAFSGGEEKWHSAQDYVLVQPSINATEVQPDPLPSEFIQMEQRVTAMKGQAEQAAQTATEQAGIATTKAQEAKQQAERVEDIIQEAEQDVLPELRQAIEDGIETKDQLDGSISSANGIKSQLDGSITAAGQAKELLDESIATGDLAAFKDEVESFKNEYATEMGDVETLTTASKQVVGAINDINAGKADKQQEAWITPTLLNGWVQDETNYPVGYMKDQFGFVHLRGRVKGGTGTMFILPTGYKPNKHIMFPIVSDASAYARAFGVVQLLGDGGGWVRCPTGLGYNDGISLDGIIFKV